MNNKVISTALLLAAGTALANAASVSLDFPESGNATGLGENTYLNLIEENISNIFTYSTYKNGDLGAFYVSSNTSGGLGNYPQNGEGTWTWSAESGTGTITLCGRKAAGGDHVAFILGGDIAVGTQLSSLTLSAGAISNESYVSSYRLIIGVLDGNNSLVESSEVATYNTDSNSASASVNFATAVTWGEGYKIIAGVVADGNSTGTNTTAFTISGISASYTVASLPEPSAFGLLAGLGALALVAARRRRGRKAA